jgi:Ca2+/Na+ antiporter
MHKIVTNIAIVIGVIVLRFLWMFPIWFTAFCYIDGHCSFLALIIVIFLYCCIGVVLESLKRKFCKHYQINWL